MRDHHVIAIPGTRRPERIQENAGAAGIVVCGVAGASRLLGSYHVMGVEALTLFVAGVGLICTGCFLKLYSGD